MLQIWHLNRGSQSLNMEQDNFILNPNVRNIQLVSKPGRGKDGGFITAFCKAVKVEFHKTDATVYSTFAG